MKGTNGNDTVDLDHTSDVMLGPWIHHLERGHDLEYNKLKRMAICADKPSYMYLTKILIVAGFFMNKSIISDQYDLLSALKNFILICSYMEWGEGFQEGVGRTMCHHAMDLFIEGSHPSEAGSAHKKDFGSLREVKIQARDARLNRLCKTQSKTKNQQLLRERFFRQWSAVLWDLTFGVGSYPEIDREVEQISNSGVQAGAHYHFMNVFLEMTRRIRIRVDEPVPSSSDSPTTSSGRNKSESKAKATSSGSTAGKRGHGKN